MNLREDRGLRLAAQGLLAFIGLVLLGAGLVLLSGAMQAGQGNVATALVIVRPAPAGGPPEPDAPAEGGRAARPGPADEVAALGPPRAPEPPLHRGRPRPDAAGGPRLAIVIDDIGHNVDIARNFLRLDYPLTYSVLPDVAHAREAAALIRRRGREYIIHLPMQPFDYPAQNPGPHPLLLSQGMEETARRLRAYLQTLPDAVGASNHMGSAYTYDEDRMRVVQTVLAERDLFFLNSKTSATRVPEQVARQWGYRYLERDVFLDHDPAEQAIEQAFRQAVRRARTQGEAIAIGHPYPQTLRVLHRSLPRLAGQGVRPVPLTELLAR